MKWSIMPDLIIIPALYIKQNKFGMQVKNDAKNVMERQSRRPANKRRMIQKTYSDYSQPHT